MSTEDLVGKLVELALSEAAPEIKTLVGHRFPDDDVWLCCWMAKQFIPKAVGAEIVFVNAGKTLPGSDGDPSVLHFDTGRGEYDQHGKGLQQTCSAAILAEKLGLENDPGLAPLIEMVTAVDNAEAFPPTSLHFVIEGYPRTFKKPDGHIDWQRVQGRVFELFDIVYGQQSSRAQARANLYKYSGWRILPNGLKVATLLGHPELREAAYEKGAAVVVWTQSRGKNHFYTGIQISRSYPELRLDKVAAALRSAEAKARGANVQGEDLGYVGRGGSVSTWFIHDSLRVILNGSRTWKPNEDEYTKLTPEQIVQLVHQALSAIPRSVVSNWHTP